MVLNIAASDCAGKADNWISGRADLRPSFLSTFAVSFSSMLGLCIRIRSTADRDDGDGDGTKNT